MSRNRIPSRASELFAVDWEQASDNGDLGQPVEAGAIRRADVKQLGDVFTGSGADGL